MTHNELLGRHVAACQGLSVYVAVLIVVAQFLLLVWAPLLIEGIVGVEVNRELPHLAYVVKVGLMLGKIAVTTCAAILKMIVGHVISF